LNFCSHTKDDKISIKVYIIVQFQVVLKISVTEACDVISTSGVLRINRFLVNIDWKNFC